MNETTNNANRRTTPLRPRILEFQSRLRGLTLAHGTTSANLPNIRKNGIVGNYVYACVDAGWEMSENEDECVDVLFAADAVADRTYPDPEGQWGPDSWIHENYSMASWVERYGMDAVLDELERFLESSSLDPRDYNLVIVGSVDPSIL